MTTNEAKQSAKLLLQQLGFTEYEAAAYMALVEHGELSGYELAKRSGIPRANVYAVIDKLHDRGAVWRVSVEKGQRVAAVPPETLLRGVRSRQREVLDAADSAFAELVKAEAPVAVYSLKGDELLSRAARLIDESRGQLEIGLQPSEAAALAAPLKRASERGVAVFTLCLEGCAQPCPGCQGELHRQALAPTDGSRWLLVVADRAEALAARFGTGAREGMATAQPLVVELVRAFIHQSVALAGTDPAPQHHWQALSGVA